MADRRTGYYVAGRDWPAIDSGIPREGLLAALERITDENIPGGPVTSPVPPHEFDPDWTIAPAATLREWMDDYGMDIYALAVGAVVFGPRSVTKDQAAALIQEVLDRKPLTANHAMALARSTGVPTYFWLNLEHTYRAGLAAGLTDTTGEAQ